MGDAEAQPARLPCASERHEPARHDPVYAALDLGTNNCRLLIARREHRARRKSDMLRVVDAFSRIVRLGEGVSQARRISEGAIERTLAALDICRDKMSARGVTRARLVATQACRAAENGEEFVQRVLDRTGLELEIIDRETEARYAARGCGALADPQADSVLLFDIGGGSTELVWLARAAGAAGFELRHWTSLEIGVVSLAEHYGGRSVDATTFAAMTERALAALSPFAAMTAVERRCQRFHLLGTSGTVTTLAGVHLGLERYDRWRVDGLWLSDEDATKAIDLLRAMDFDQRSANGCIGPQRADLVLAGCAIFEAIRSVFPAARTRIADRGLREGILLELMEEDGLRASER
ncbi:Ppx/GppA family phosphatase [Methylosinus trichosporium OB3b]|uniref:Ppx/GppA family phosphatase n=1 Tax=Methylosinus trichosporium (strain ATCC 35070 / NCIMB 11131 / UNIQEM 75 / OB3b) TaxID=595536 RepID=A0A2D2D647_METT3|nr:Ppx/GppA family phosphatase [Methylosinus trichosporium OB3b]OBS54363.1 exopolyphosphatase [Methylosinus sp. 3S-1]